MRFAWHYQDLIGFFSHWSEGICQRLCQRWTDGASSFMSMLLEHKHCTIFCTFVVSTCPRTVTMPLWWLLMMNIIYANVIRPGKTIAELRVPTEIYHRTQRDSKPSIKILDFSRLNLHVINKAEEREVCRTTSWSLVSCVTPGKGHGQILRWRRWCLDLCPLQEVTGSVALKQSFCCAKVLQLIFPVWSQTVPDGHRHVWPHCSKQHFCSSPVCGPPSPPVSRDVFSHLPFEGVISACVNMTQLTGCAEPYK